MHTLTCGLDIQRDTLFRFLTLSDVFSTLVCLELTGESSNSLSLWQSHLYAVRHDTAFRKIIEMTVLLVAVSQFTLGSRILCPDDGSKGTIIGSTGVKVRG